jgi:hypothetical protein
MTDPDLKVRRAVAQAHGLDWPAAKLLVGETIPELEESASRLAEILRARNEQQERAEQPRSPSSFFAVAAAEKAELRERLLSALCGRAQPRDQVGRYATADHPAGAASGFDGGARQPVRRVESHESWLAAALGDHETGGALRLQ